MSEEDTQPSAVAAVAVAAIQAEKPTVKFEPPPKWAEDMFGRVHTTMASVEARLSARLGEQDQKLDHCISGLKTLNGDLEDLKRDHHEFKGATAARFEAGSMRAKAITLTNEVQDQKISELSESQLSKLVKDAAKTPMGQKVVTAGGAVVLALLGLASIAISLHASKLQAQAPVAPPATVYVVAPDAGAR